MNTQYEQMVAALKKSGTDIQESLTPQRCDVVHMTMGIAGEAGELLDAIKKHIIYNKPLDVENVIEELGDLEFYMEGLRQALGLTREQILLHNYQKLYVKRYPNGYSDEAAQTRADKQ